MSCRINRPQVDLHAYFFRLAQRAFIAMLIRLRAAADIRRRPILPFVLVLALPPRSSRLARRATIARFLSASNSAWPAPYEIATRTAK